MAPQYKLTYFNVTGLGDPIRYIFAYAKQEFEDNRITLEQWAELKSKTPFGQIPILEIDGKPVSQSMSIARYLANQFGLTGKDDWEKLQADVLVDTFGDYRQLIKRAFSEKDEEKLAQINKERAFYHEKFNKIVSENPSGFLVGSQITWADLIFASAFSDIQTREVDVLTPYPDLAKLVKTVNNIPHMKTYLETRPKLVPVQIFFAAFFKK